MQNRASKYHMVEFSQKKKRRIKGNIIYRYNFMYCTLFGTSCNFVIEHENGRPNRQNMAHRSWRKQVIHNWDCNWASNIRIGGTRIKRKNALQLLLIVGAVVFKVSPWILQLMRIIFYKLYRAMADNVDFIRIDLDDKLDSQLHHLRVGGLQEASNYDRKESVFNR